MSGQPVYAFRLDRRKEDERQIAEVLDGWIAEVKDANPDHGVRQIMIPLLQRYMSETAPYQPEQDRARAKELEAVQRQLDQIVALIRGIKANPGAVMSAINDVDEDEIDTGFIDSIMRGMARGGGGVKP